LGVKNPLSSERVIILDRCRSLHLHSSLNDLPAGFEEFQYGGNEGDEHDSKDHKLKFFYFTKGLFPKKEPKKKDSHPDNSIHHVIDDELSHTQPNFPTVLIKCGVQ